MSHRAPAPSADVADVADGGASSLIEAFGGVRGMIDMTLPGLAFIVLYTITQSVLISSWSAVGVMIGPVAWRLWHKETLKHAFGGLLGVAIGAFIAIESGKPQNFYLGSMIYGLVLLVVWGVSALVRWPLLGVMLGPILGENMTWRTQNPGRLAAYTKATWVWVALFAIRALILFPLYWAGQVTWLGVAKIALGVPPWLVAIYLSWLILSKAPAPIKVAQDEDEDADDPETQAARAVDEAVDDALHDLASSPVPQEHSER